MRIRYKDLSDTPLLRVPILQRCPKLRQMSYNRNSFGPFDTETGFVSFNRNYLHDDYIATSLSRLQGDIAKALRSHEPDFFIEEIVLTCLLHWKHTLHYAKTESMLSTRALNLTLGKLNCPCPNSPWGRLEKICTCGSCVELQEEVKEVENLSKAASDRVSQVSRIIELLYKLERIFEQSRNNA